MSFGSDIEPFRLIKASRRLLRRATALLEGQVEVVQDDDLRFETLISLGKIGDPASLNVLQSALDLYPDRMEPITALGFYHNSTPVIKLMKLLENHEHPFKEEVVRVLGEIADPVAGKVLMELLHDQDRMVRYHASWALYKIGGRDVAQNLCRLLSDPDEWIVINVLDILSRLKEVEAIPALVGQFEIARDPRLKAIIISSLAGFAETQLLKVFEEGLKSFDPRIQANAVEAISMLKISGLEMKRKLKRFYAHPNNRVRANTALALHKADEDKVLEEIKAMIGSPDIATRRSAAFVLSKAAVKGRDEFIDRLLGDSSYAVRKMALKAVLALGGSVGIARIQPLLKDQNVWVRREAVDCAHKIPDFPAQAILDTFKGEKSPPVLESMLDFIVDRHLDQAVDGILSRIREKPEEGLPKLINSLGRLNARDSIVKVRKSLGSGTAETMREFFVALLLHGELAVLEEVAVALQEKKRDEELLLYVKVAGEIGAFLQNTEGFSKKLIDALTVEVRKDMEGVSTFQDPTSGPVIKKEAISAGISLISQGRLDEASAFFTEYLKAYPGNTDGLYHFSTVLFRKGDPEKAMEVLLELMEKTPGHIAGELLLGQIHFQKKRWDELVKLYESLQKRIPAGDLKTIGQVQGALGLAYFHLKRYQKAIETLGRALNSNPRDLSSCYHLALCYYAVKEHGKALMLLRNLRQSLPNDSRVFRNVEELIQKLEDEG